MLQTQVNINWTSSFKSLQSQLETDFEVQIQTYFNFFNLVLVSMRMVNWKLQNNTTLVSECIVAMWK